MDRPLSIVIAAMGGQGGATLASWIVAAAETAGWHAQSTSVPGVAQRTGATLYYLELMPAGERRPVFALMPAPGDVDIVVAAELMEAGRAILRGLVTPERTLLIASDHRAYAMAEKEVPGDGIADPGTVRDAARAAAKRLVLFDMNAIAARHGTVISAPLFGALAGSGALAIAREDFEAAVQAEGRGVNQSLSAFAQAYEKTRNPGLERLEVEPRRVTECPSGAAQMQPAFTRIRAELPRPAWELADAGAGRLHDYQDTEYVSLYLDRVAEFHAFDHGSGGWALTCAAAKQIAVAMAYDDVIRVADLKTRAARFARIESEMGASGRALVVTTEFMRPGAAELLGVLPARLGTWIEVRPRLVTLVERIGGKGRRVRTTSLGWFLALYLLAGLRRFRRGNLRHARETAWLDRWLALALQHAETDPALAAEILNARRLVKGYADTHSRGLSKYDRVAAALPLIAGRADAAAWLRRLIASALQDEEGLALDGALKTVASLSLEPLPPPRPDAADHSLSKRIGGGRSGMRPER